MKRKISRSILQLLTISSLLLLPATGWSQIKVIKAESDKDAKKTSFYQGTSVGLEIAGMGSYLLGSDILNSDIQVQANLWNRILPIVEVGFGKTDIISDATDIHYKTSAPYFRIGADYNILHKKTHLPGMLVGGIRYGFSSFSYDVEGPTMTDPNYGGIIEAPFSYLGQECKAHWVEAVVGLKVKIYRSFWMGWNIRIKKRMSFTKHENSEPWYVPGFGKNSGSSFNLSYHLIYNLPF